MTRPWTSHSATNRPGSCCGAEPATTGRQRFWLQKQHFDGRLRICSQDHVALAQAMLDADAELLSQTVHAHIERLRASVLARLESAGSLLPVADPLAVVSRQLPTVGSSDEQPEV